MSTSKPSSRRRDTLASISRGTRWGRGSRSTSRRPGLAIGRRGTGIKELTERVAQKFNLPNPQIAVSEVERPELNPRIMAQRTAQIVARGTAFRRAANWTMTTIMEAGAMGCEIGVAGKLRSDRAHKEKYRMGVVPKSGETADEIVRSATTDVLLKLGLFGIKVKIAIADALPPPDRVQRTRSLRQPRRRPHRAPSQPPWERLRRGRCAPEVVMAEATTPAAAAAARRHLPSRPRPRRWLRPSQRPRGRRQSPRRRAPSAPQRGRQEPARGRPKKCCGPQRRRRKGAKKERRRKQKVAKSEDQGASRAGP